MIMSIPSIICKIAPGTQSIWLWLFIASLVILIAFVAGFFVFYSKKVNQFKDYKNSMLKKMRDLQAEAQCKKQPEEPSENPKPEEIPSESDTRIVFEKEIADMKAMLNDANMRIATLENELEMSKDQIKMKDHQLEDLSNIIDNNSHAEQPSPAITYNDNSDEDNRVTKLLMQLNEANGLREQAESEAREINRTMLEIQNECTRLKEELNGVNHAYDQYQAEYQKEKERHEAELSQMRNESERNMQNLDNQHSRQLAELLGQKDEELSKTRNDYERRIRDLQSDFERASDRIKSEYEQRINELVAKHGMEIEDAKRAIRMETLRINDEFEKKLNDQAAKHSAEIHSLTAAYHAEITEKSSLLEQKERQLDMIQAKFQTEIHRITEENEEKTAIALAAKEAEIGRTVQEMDSAIKMLEKRASTLSVQLQAGRDELVASIINRFDSMTPAISRLAADARAVDSGSMAAYMAENMLDSFGYAVSDFKHAADTLGESDSIPRIQSKLRASLVEKWVDQNGWIAILSQLTAYARIPAMHDSLLASGIDTMLLARLQADAQDLLGLFDVSIIVPSILADEFDSASMESVTARTIIDRINPDIMPRDYVGKVFDLVLPGISTPSSSKKPRVAYF